MSSRFAKLRASFALLALFALTACDHVGPYVPPVQQGTALNNQAIDQLHEGMTKEQVVNLVGEPVVSDPYNSLQWTYVYRFKRQGHALEHQYLVVRFSADGKVTKILTDEHREVTLPEPDFHQATPTDTADQP